MTEILDAGFKHDVYTGLKTIFNDALNGGDYTPQSRPLIEEVTSSNLAETYDWLLDNFGLRKWVGEKHVKNLKGKGLTIKNEPYEDTFGMQTRILRTEGGASRYAPRVKMLARGANRFIDELSFAVLQAGLTVNGIDGVPFFSNAHPLDAGGTYSNYGGGAGTAWYLFDLRICKPVIFQWLQKPETKESDKDEFDKGLIYFGAEADAGAGLSLWQAAYASKQTLDADAFDAAVAQMMKVPRDGGEVGVGTAMPLGVMPTLLVVGPANRAAAKAIIEKESNAQGSNTNYKAVEVMVTPFLP